MLMRNPDMKLHLQTTSYGSFLANESSPLAVSVIDEKLKEKLVNEFQHIRKQCVEPLATFLDFITWVQVGYPFSVFFFFFLKVSPFSVQVQLHDRQHHPPHHRHAARA
jgi:hypothetical protein